MASVHRLLECNCFMIYWNLWVTSSLPHVWNCSASSAPRSAFILQPGCILNHIQSIPGFDLYSSCSILKQNQGMFWCVLPWAVSSQHLLLGQTLLLSKTERRASKVELSFKVVLLLLILAAKWVHWLSKACSGKSQWQRDSGVSVSNKAPVNAVSGKIESTCSAAGLVKTDISFAQNDFSLKEQR